MRTLPRLLLQRDADRKERDEQLQQIVEAGQLVLKERDEQLQQIVKDVIDATVTSADSELVKAFRAATKERSKGMHMPRTWG
jgi:Asp-tRNA(Asn)/Glu-tRNA(Gln) amidotransferase B subunit